MNLRARTTSRWHFPAARPVLSPEQSEAEAVAGSSPLSSHYRTRGHRVRAREAHAGAGTLGGATCSGLRAKQERPLRSLPSTGRGSPSLLEAGRLSPGKHPTRNRRPPPCYGGVSPRVPGPWKESQNLSTPERTGSAFPEHRLGPPLRTSSGRRRRSSRFGNLWPNGFWTRAPPRPTAQTPPGAPRPLDSTEEVSLSASLSAPPRKRSSVWLLIPQTLPSAERTISPFELVLVHDG